MRRLVCVALACACLIAPLGASAADPAPDLATLLAKNVAATGPEPANYRETLTMTSPDGDVSTVHILTLGKDVRETIDAGSIHTESGTASGEDWNQNENGLTVIDPADPSATPITTSSTFHESDAATVRSTADGLVISDLDKNGFGSRRYIDPVTFLTTRFERVRRSGTTTIAYEDDQQYGGQTLPSHWTITFPDGRAYTVARGERVIGAVTAAQVAEPGIRRALVDFPDDKPVEIPTSYHAGQYFIHATINGHRATFLLDTGADGIYLDTDTARKFGLTLVNRVRATNAAAADFYSTTVHSIGLGAAAMHDIVINTGPVRFQESWNSDVVGLIGFDFLATIGLTIDNEHQRLIATPFASFTPPSGSNVVPIDIRLGMHVPTVSVLLDHVEADRFVVDTGDGLGTYTVFDYFMDRHPHVGERSSNFETADGVGGPMTIHEFHVHTFHFGTYDFTDFGGSSAGAGSFPQPEDGILGTLFLVLFNIDFDYPHGRMYLTPTTNTKQMLHIH